MNEETIEKVYDALIELFEMEFQKDMSRITRTGAINFDAEKSFGLWFQLSERLRKSSPKLYQQLTYVLRRHYAGKTYAEVLKEESRPRPKESGELFYDAIMEYADDDF